MIASQYIRAARRRAVGKSGILMFTVVAGVDNPVIQAIGEFITPSPAEVATIQTLYEVTVA